MEYGKIIAFCGPIFAGKSRELVKISNEAKTKGINVEAFKPSKHYQDGNFIKSRDGGEIPCRLLDDMEEVLESRADLIVIDEYQFIKYKELDHILKELKLKKKTAIIGGLCKLSVDTYFENFKLLQKYTDRIVYLKAKCTICGKDAELTQRTTGEKAEEMMKKFKTDREPRCYEHLFD